MKIKMIDYGFKNEPLRAHGNDAGADVYINEKITIQPGRTKKIPLGFGLQLPDGFMALILPRSSMSSQGIVSEIPPIDSGYRGEIHAIITNHTDAAYTLNEGVRVAQIVVIPIVVADFVSEVGDERGENGFGSTGV